MENKLIFMQTPHLYSCFEGSEHHGLVLLIYTVTDKSYKIHFMITFPLFINKF